MNAVDTNILARFFVSDPDDVEAIKQHPAAEKAMSEKVFVSTSVVLEFEWVLRGFYELPRKQIQAVLEALCGLENVFFENREAFLTALNYFQQGLDFADALHLANAGSCKTFKTFDQKLLKRAKIIGSTISVESP